MRILHDGRLGKFEVPREARCPKCARRVSENDSDPRHMGVALKCPKCAHRWIIPFSHPTHWQHLRAPNDSNGNPRRCFALYDAHGTICDVIDEGYSGVPEFIRRGDYVQLPSVEVSASEYKQFLAVGRAAVGYSMEA